VAQAGNIVYSRGYGMADLDHNIPITPSTVFHACSLAKQFTAMAILLLGIPLNTEAHTLIPELKNAPVPPVPPTPSPATQIAPVTIEQMLHHISGIRDQWILATLAGWRLSDDVISLNDVLNDLVPKMKTLNFSPGTSYAYSNTNYTLAGEIVKRVSTISLAEFCRTNIFQPLGMASTTITETHGQIVNNRAYGYYKGLHPYYEMRMPNYDLTGPTNLLTTVEDLIRWDRNFDLKAVGGAAAIAAMQTPVPHSNNYGLGLIKGTDHGHTVFEHDGRDPGHRSHLIRYPAQHLTIALLGNVQLPPDIFTSDLVRSVAAIFLNNQPPVASTTAPTASTFVPTNLNEFLGQYYSDEVDNFCEVVLDESSIAIRHRKYYDLAKMVAASSDTFTMTNFSVVLNSATVKFHRTQGQIDGFFIDDSFGSNRLHNFWFAKQP
jgi:CubicO group peptidase (beta-lactamase class C family)